MPSQLLHILHGLAVLEALEKNRPRLCAVRSSSLLPSFCLGCQGPDIFYHNQRTRPVGLEYGSLMHRRGYGAVTAVLLGEALERFRTRGEADHELAYALGFATHAFLDRALHPYIISRSGSGGSTAETAARALHHIFLERLLDAAFVEECRAESWFQPLGPFFDRVDGNQLLAGSFRQAELLAKPARALSGLLVPLFSKALVAAYPGRAGRDRFLTERLEHVCADAAYFYEHSDPRHARARFRAGASSGISLARARYLAAILYPCALPHGVDVLNRQGAPWIHPCEGMGLSHASVRQLFDAAVLDASRALACVLDMQETEDIASCAGSESLSINDAEGRRCLPRHFTPLPMDMLLDAQAAAWREGNLDT